MSLPFPRVGGETVRPFFFNNTGETIVYHLLFSRGHKEGMREGSVDPGNEVGDHSSMGSQ